MFVNVDKLNGKIAERRINKSVIANEIGIDRSTLDRRIKQGKLLIGDMHKMYEILQLSDLEAIEIFLAQ